MLQPGLKRLINTEKVCLIVKIVKYGYGRELCKWYPTKCKHCGTQFKAASTEVWFLDEHGNSINDPSLYYETTCPVCDVTDNYKLTKLSSEVKETIAIAICAILQLVGCGAIYALLDYSKNETAWWLASETCSTVSLSLWILTTSRLNLSKIDRKD